MPTMTVFEQVFIISAFLYQILLLLNFIGRNVRPELELKYGWIIYALGIPALVVGSIYLSYGQPWYYTSAYFVFALWGGFGYYIDSYRKIEWRNPPKISILIPYVALYIGSLFSFWIPLWDIGMTFWWAYTIFYVVNTILNIAGHRWFSKPVPKNTTPAL